MKFLLILLLVPFCLSAQTSDLDFFISQGLANNPGLNEIQNQQQSAELDKQLADVNYKYPNGYVSADFMQAPVYNGVGYDEAISNGGQYSALIGVKLPLLQNNLAATEKNKIDVSIQQLNWQAQQLKRDLKKQIADAYLKCYASQQLLNVARQQEQIIEDQLKATKDLAQQNVTRSSDVIQMQLEVQNQQLQTRNYQSQQRSDYLALVNLCGMKDTNNRDLQKAQLQLPDSVKSPQQSIQQFTLDSLMAYRQQKVFELRYKPQLSAYADAGLNAVKMVHPANNLGYSFGLNLSVNLFDFQKEKHKQQMKLNVNTANTYRDNFERQRNIHLAQTHQQFEMAVQRLEILNAQQDNYKLILKMYDRQLGEGNISVLDYLLTFRRSVQAKTEIIQVQLERDQAINTFNYWNW